ncbi:hypothetical protein [Lactobacillus sp. PV034]|uniref:hypothetical protein n=1 Tax=Lactobacillus sp. PV034 TaxID=2594495 RepID=UPI0022406EAD|nr:hypothetical protein [Lactobacillus sp. PV034]QNQ81341.1 hypothetical protein FP432_07115 [Lactobacillus sp. PV034]
MKYKYFALIDDVVIKSSALFPYFLYAVAVVIKGNIITFAWPFILGYTAGQVAPFLIDEKIDKNWPKSYRTLSLVSLVAVFSASVGIYLRWEWLASIGAMGLSLSVTGLSSLSDNKHYKINFKRIDTFAAILVSINLLILGFLAIKISVVSAYIAYAVLLLAESIGIFKHYKIVKTNIKWHLFNTSTRSAKVTIAVFVGVFIISIFKRIGYFSDVSWFFLFISIIYILVLLNQFLHQRFKLLRIWIGAVRNYLIIFTIILAFQIHQNLWIFLIFIELAFAGIFVKFIQRILNYWLPIYQFYITMALVDILLVLMVYDKFYLLITWIILILLINLTVIANQKLPIVKTGIKSKIKVLGGLISQAVLFSVLQLVAQINLKNRIALVTPYIMHQQDLKYGSEMILVRIVMAALFILTGIGITIYDHRQLKR